MRNSCVSFLFFLPKCYLDVTIIQPISVKPEPRETVIAPLALSNSDNQVTDNAPVAVKAEPSDVARVVCVFLSERVVLWLTPPTVP